MSPFSSRAGYCDTLNHYGSPSAYPNGKVEWAVQPQLPTAITKLEVVDGQERAASPSLYRLGRERKVVKSVGIPTPNPPRIPLCVCSVHRCQPLSHRAHYREGDPGVEPGTYGLTIRCSTTELITQTTVQSVHTAATETPTARVNKSAVERGGVEPPAVPPRLIAGFTYAPNPPRRPILFARGHPGLIRSSVDRWAVRYA